MKRVQFALAGVAAISLLLWSAACAAVPQRPDRRDANAALDTVNAGIAHAYAVKDPRAYAALFTDSASFEWPAVPTVRGRSGLEAMAREVWAPLRNIELRITVASRHIAGDHATEFGAFEESWDGDSAKRHTEYGRYVSTFRRQHGEWRMHQWLGFEDSTRSRVRR